MPGGIGSELQAELPSQFRIARIVNVGHPTSPTAFSQKFANRRYTLAPNEQAFVPYDAIYSWFGNPSLIDIDARRRDRTDEYMRLRYKYGAHDSDARFEVQRPYVECYDAATNERMWSVLDDPDGSKGSAATVDLNKSGMGVAELQAAMNAMNQQMQTLIALNEQQASANARMAATASASTLPAQTADGSEDDGHEGAAMGAPNFAVDSLPPPAPVAGVNADEANVPGTNAQPSGVVAGIQDPTVNPRVRTRPDTPTRPKAG